MIKEEHMNASRIPDFADLTPDGMQFWFAEMSVRGLIFHPEEAPREMQLVATGERMFNVEECAKLEVILSTMFTTFGDGVVDAAYPIFMRKAGAPHALDT